MLKYLKCQTGVYLPLFERKHRVCYANSAKASVYLGRVLWLFLIRCNHPLFKEINGSLSVRVTTKLWRIAERHKPSSGRKGDHEVVEGACVSIKINIAKNP